MAMLHEPATRASIETRLNALQPDAARKWGSMSPAQALWHMNQFLAFALGEGTYEPMKAPLPPALFRFVLLHAPWPKGAPTHPQARAEGEHDFESERARCLSLIEKFVSRPLDGAWPTDPAFGKVTGKFASKLQAKHFDHHLRQFGA